MADLIKIKGGEGEVPKLEERELGYSMDENALYIGTKDENKKISGGSSYQENILYIDYGSKTKEDIQAAINLNKFVICVYSEKVGDDKYNLYFLPLVKQLNNGGFVFSAISGTTSLYAKVLTQGWDFSKSDLATE